MIDARFVGVNLRVGYVLPGLTDPWRLSFLGGVYYTTMLVTGRSISSRDRRPLCPAPSEQDVFELTVAGARETVLTANKAGGAVARTASAAI